MARAGPDRADEPLGPTGAGHDPDGDLRLPEAGVVAGDDQVADQGQLAAATQGEAADRGDERDADRGDRVPGVEVPLAGESRRGLLGELEDVGTGGERPVAGTGQDDDAAVRVLVEGLSAVARSASTAKLRALRTSGRSIVTRATPGRPRRDARRGWAGRGRGLGQPWAPWARAASVQYGSAGAPSKTSSVTRSPGISSRRFGRRPASPPTRGRRQGRPVVELHRRDHDQVVAGQPVGHSLDPGRAQARRPGDERQVFVPIATFEGFEGIVASIRSAVQGEQRGHGVLRSGCRANDDTPGRRHCYDRRHDRPGSDAPRDAHRARLDGRDGRPGRRSLRRIDPARGPQLPDLRPALPAPVPARPRAGQAGGGRDQRRAGPARSGRRATPSPPPPPRSPTATTTTSSRSTSIRPGPARRPTPT